MPKIFQYIHHPNNTELGKGNTHETYLLIAKEHDLFDLFPNGKDIKLKVVDKDDFYTVRSSVGREFRINQFGPLYRDYDVCEGDEVILTIIDNLITRDYFVRVNKYNRLLFTQSNKGCTIGNIERISTFGDRVNGYVLNAVMNGNNGTLKIDFDSAKAKRTDSPDLTDFYRVTFNGYNLENGTYFYDINDGIIGNFPKATLNEVILNGEYCPNTSTPKNIIKSPSQISYDKYLTALRTKPFMLLAGISGTGKSRIVRELAFKSCPKNLQDKDGTTPGNYLMVEVKPNWHDSSELLGYYSQLANDRKGEYIFKPFTKFLVKAMMFPEVPFFVCLDEMNLAPVEQYFAEFLSVLETRKKTDNGVKTGVLVEAKNFQTLPRAIEADGFIARGFYPEISYIPNDIFNVTELTKHGLTLPKNVFIIGTVNMDDTTHQFSRKVIDRAMTIEMNGGNLMDMFGGSEDMKYLPDDQVWKLSEFQPKYVTADDVLDAYPQYAANIQQDLPEKLDGINKILEGTPFQVSYRVLNELVIFLSVLLDDGMDYDTAVNQAVDQILLMKILPRIEGDRDLLTKGKDQSRLALLEPYAITDTTKNKLKEMQERLDSQEFTRFWP